MKLFAWLRSACVLLFSIWLMPAAAEADPAALMATVEQIEGRGARVGIVLKNTGTGWLWHHRADERFPMDSTFKVALCGTVLKAAEEGKLALDDMLAVNKADLLSYAPVTRKHAGRKMTIAALCLAALEMSDNTAANLLMAKIGGPAAVTAFFRRIGDKTSRLDRMEPDLNISDPQKDTTTPAAMAETLQALLIGDALDPASRCQLISWMGHGSLTGPLRAGNVPKGWLVADKTGAGDKTRNLVAMVGPPHRPPWIVTIFIADDEEDFAARNAALKKLCAAVSAVIHPVAGEADFRSGSRPATP